MNDQTKNSGAFKNKLYSWVFYTFICSIGVYIAFYPTLTSGFSFIQTDPGDTRLVNYFLEHSFQVFFNREYIGDLWSPPFFYPYQNVLAFSENMFGSAPIYWLFRAFLSSDIAFQLWMITVCILCFISFVILMRRHYVGQLLAGLGAFLFTFNLPRITQIGHQQLLPQFFTPLTFLVVWDFVKQPTRKRLILILLLSYLQLLAGVYLGWFLLLSLLIFFCIIYTINLELRNKIFIYLRSEYKAVIIIILGWLILIGWTFFPYLQAMSVFGRRPYAEVDSMLPRLSSWFAVPPGTLWSPLLGSVSQGLPNLGEHYMFSGFTLILLAGISIYTIFYLKKEIPSERSLLVKSCLLVFITIFILSLRLPFGLSLWNIVYEVVPGASVIRAVTRIWTIAYFYLLIAVIVWLDSFLKNKYFTKKAYLLIVSIVFLIVVSEQFRLNLPSFEKAGIIKTQSAISELIKDKCDVAYLALNPENPFYVDQLSAMWAGIQANIPVVNGYSGNVPPGYGDASKPMTTEHIAHWLDKVHQPKSNKQKKLCMISYKSIKTKDNFISQDSNVEETISSENFSASIVQLPIKKVFNQEIKYFDSIKDVKINSLIKIPVTVKNISNFTWSNKPEYNPTNFSYRWIDSTGKLAIFDGDGERTPLPYDLAPGELTRLNVTIKTPKSPGKYRLILTMVQEGIVWFNDKTNSYTEIAVNVISY